VVSARDGEADKVAGLDSGADDYVVKPFAARELTARIWAVMRRRREWREAVPREPGVLTAGPVRLDVERHVVTVAGRRVELPLREFELLTLLLRNAGRVLTRAQLTGLLWGPGHAAGGRSRTLDVHVKRLRERIEPDPAAPRHLLTVRGVGYKFEP
jgi:two-component system response regulator RegX3